MQPLSRQSAYDNCMDLDDARLPDRFWRKVRKPDNPEDCWLWTATITRGGYGMFKWDGKSRTVHRVTMSIVTGPLPSDLVVDHQCHNLDLGCKGGVSCLHRRCVNPAHMRLVSSGDNTRAGRESNPLPPECKNGHAFAGDNLGPPRADGGRSCRACARENYRKRTGASPRRQKPFCKNGHAMEGENIYLRPDGTGRGCIACRRRVKPLR